MLSTQTAQKILVPKFGGAIVLKTSCVGDTEVADILRRGRHTSASGCRANYQIGGGDRPEISRNRRGFARRKRVRARRGGGYRTAGGGVEQLVGTDADPAQETGQGVAGAGKYRPGDAAACTADVDDLIVCAQAKYDGVLGQ